MSYESTIISKLKVFYKTRGGRDGEEIESAGCSDWLHTRGWGVAPRFGSWLTGINWTVGPVLGIPLMGMRG